MYDQKLQEEKKKMKEDIQQMKQELIYEQKEQREHFEQDMQVEKDQTDILTFKINDLEAANKQLKAKILKIQKKTSATEKEFKSKIEEQMNALKLQYEKKKKAVETFDEELLTYAIDYEKEYYPSLKRQLDDILHNMLLDRIKS